MRSRWSILAAAALLCARSDASAQVVETSDAGFTVRHVERVGQNPHTVYLALVNDLGQWWHPAHTFSGEAGRLTLDARPGGCWCETLPREGGVRHLTVVMVEPGRRLRLVGALGPLQEAAVTGSMTWEFADSAGSTVLTVTYVVGGYRAGGLARLAEPVRQVLAEAARRLKEYVERTRP